MTKRTTLDMDLLQRNAERESAIAAGLDPSLPIVTKIVMASDIRAAEDALAAVDRGEIEPERALVFAGSYSRITTLLTLVDRGKITLPRALDLLPELWPGSDPDDTDPRIIDLWRQAAVRHGSVITDGPKLPRRRTLTVYRGQRRSDPLGCAWSLSEDIATKFANGASFRVAAVADPVLYELNVPRDIVIAYLTRRGEEEIILDPLELKVKR